MPRLSVRVKIEVFRFEVVRFSGECSVFVLWNKDRCGEGVGAVVAATTPSAFLGLNVEKEGFKRIELCNCFVRDDDARPLLALGGSIGIV